MHISLNPALIRVVLIALFFIVPLVLRAARLSASSKPASSAGERKKSPLESLREAMLQAAEQAGTAQNGKPAEKPAGEVRAAFQQPSKIGDLRQPPAIGPESSFIPSLLLLALLACLFLMAYRYWAG